SLPTTPGWRLPAPAAAGAPCCVSGRACAAATASPPRTAGTRVCDLLASLRVPTGPASAGSRTGAGLRPTRAAASAAVRLLFAAAFIGTLPDRDPSAHRRVAGSALLPTASPAPHLAASAGLPLFCQHRVQCPDVHRLLGYDMLQLSILLLELLQPPCFAHVHAAVLRLPSVIARSCDPMPPAQLSRLHPGLRLLQDGDDLFFAESTLAHDSSSDPGRVILNGEVSLTMDYFL